LNSQRLVDLNIGLDRGCMLQCQGDITRARWNLVVKINVSFCLLSLFKVWPNQG
jgi:hypothetical protein